eukprot:10959793-Lingulodinium_polyedra.AAC.1
MACRACSIPNVESATAGAAARMSAGTSGSCCLWTPRSCHEMLQRGAMPRALWPPATRSGRIKV